MDSSLRAKLAKLLRLQQSDNANEAANAAAFVERLCRQHGVSAAEVSADFDPAMDTAVQWFHGRPFKRADVGTRMLLQAVVSHYNGQLVQDNRQAHTIGTRYSVMATEGNRVQIELYFDYLCDTMNRLADEAKKRQPWSDRTFKANFRKGFAYEIRQRLAAMKSQQMERGNDAGVPGLVLANRAAMEKRIVDALVKQHYPRLKTGSRVTFGGSGIGAGRQAATGVGLNKQVRTGQVRALAGC